MSANRVSDRFRRGSLTKPYLPGQVSVAQKPGEVTYLSRLERYSLSAAPTLPSLLASKTVDRLLLICGPPRVRSTPGSQPSPCTPSASSRASEPYSQNTFKVDERAALTSRPDVEGVVVLAGILTACGDRDLTCICRVTRSRSRRPAGSTWNPTSIQQALVHRGQLSRVAHHTGRRGQFGRTGVDRCAGRRRR